MRLPVALALAVVAAEAAVVLLRPRHGVIDVDSVSATSYFSPARIARAQDFSHPQLMLYGATLLIEGGLLVWLVRSPPRAFRARKRRPVLAAAAAGAALSTALTVATLPISAISRHRAENVGLVTQSWAGWAEDVAKSLAIQAALTGIGAAILIALIRRHPRRWWLPASGVVVAAGVIFTYAGPVVLDPVFNRFTPLRGEARADVLELASKAGVKVGQVYEVDAGRRTTAANAYVNGLGSTKRVVVYDTLLKSFTRDERRLVLAHELGHVHYRDVPRGLLYLLLVTPFGLFAVARLAESLEGSSEHRAGPQSIPALALSLAIVATGVTTISNQLSRGVEARADSFALQITRQPQDFIAFERKITLQNVADPDPPAWLHWLLGTHPTTMQRIGAAIHDSGQDGMGGPQ
jgi:STE24 endopeptidase